MLLSEAMKGQDTYTLPAIFPVIAPGIIVTLYSLAALTIALNSFSKSFYEFCKPQLWQTDNIYLVVVRDVMNHLSYALKCFLIIF